MKFFKKYIKNYWKLFCIAVACLTLEAACDLMQPTIMSKIVDIGVKRKDMSYVMHMGLVMLMITAFGALAATGRNILASYVSQKFGAELRVDLFKKIHTLSFENIDKYDGASLVTRLTNDVTQVQNFVNGLMRIFVKAPLLCIGSLIMAVRLNPKMSLVFVFVIPVIVILIYLNMRIGYPFFRKIQSSLDNVNAVMREYLSGVRVVKAFNRFNYETERFKKVNKDFTDLSTKAMRVMAIFSPAINLVINLGIASIIWFGGVRVNNGDMQVGQVIAFTNYMTQILFSLMMISFIFTMLVKAKASAERIGEVFEEKSTIKNKSMEAQSPFQVVNNSIEGDALIEGSYVNEKIEFENVFFSYAGTVGEPVLKNISFTCNAGETIGIIGSTGCGKSSLVNLISRFYDVTSGEVRIDGINIKEIDEKTLRNKIAVVPQKIMLFSGTVLDNIKWGKGNASIEEVEVAAKVAQAHEFITSLGEGYNTILGQGGVNLSGGQKQRISIARALIKKPQILILDDCTSAVDVTTEMKIRTSLNKLLNNVTCITIAQRITSVMGADKIIVLDNGQIVGMGKHEELMKSSEVYKDIYRSQIGKVGGMEHVK